MGPIPDHGERPLSFIERDMVARLQGQPTSLARVAAARRLDGPLDEEALVRAVAGLFERHDAMWTAFSVTDGVPRAWLDPTKRGTLRVVEAADAGAALEEMHAENRLAFDLARAPLCRFLLCRVSPVERYFLCTAHHVVTDFRGMQILARDLARLYAAARSGATPLLRPITVHNRQIGAWQAAWLDDELLAHFARYWRQQLPADAAPPVLRGARVVDGPRARSRRDQITAPLTSPALAAQLDAFGVAERLPTASLLLALLLAVLRAEGERAASVVDVFSSNRRKETLEVLGGFTLLLPLRTTVEPDDTLVSLTRRVSDGLARMVQHQDVPAAVALAGVVRDPPRVVFNCLPQITDDMFSFDGVRTTHLAMPVERPILWDIEVQLEITASRGIVLLLMYNAELYERAIMERFIRRYATLTERAMETPGALLKSLTDALDDGSA